MPRTILTSNARKATAATATALALCMTASSAAHASVSCTYAGAPEHVMTVTISGTSEAAVKRRGQEILAMPWRESPLPCAGGVPTVLNTDTIRVVFSKSDARGVELQLDGGAFAPGVSPEADGAPEIEIEVSGARGMSAGVVGTRGDDQFRWVAAGDQTGLNLNPGSGDHDADVAIVGDEDEIGPLLAVHGGAGDDTIVADPTAPVRGAGAFTVGGSGDDVLGAYGPSYLLGAGGNDTITGSKWDDVLEGDAGNDRITGRGGKDNIDGGRGADRISGGSGRDAIIARDASRDTVACGPDRDRVDVDRRDTTRDCERVNR